MHKLNKQKSAELCPPSLLDVTPLCWDFKLHRSLGFEPAVHPKSSSRHSFSGPMGSLNSPETQRAYFSGYI